MSIQSLVIFPVDTTTWTPRCQQVWGFNDLFPSIGTCLEERVIFQNACCRFGLRRCIFLPYLPLPGSTAVASSACSSNVIRIVAMDIKFGLLLWCLRQELCSHAHIHPEMEDFECFKTIASLYFWEGWLNWIMPSNFSGTEWHNWSFSNCIFVYVWKLSCCLTSAEVRECPLHISSPKKTVSLPYGNAPTPVLFYFYPVMLISL